MTDTLELDGPFTIDYVWYMKSYQSASLPPTFSEYTFFENGTLLVTVYHRIPPLRDHLLVEGYNETLVEVDGEFMLFLEGPIPVLVRPGLELPKKLSDLTKKVTSQVGPFYEE